MSEFDLNDEQRAIREAAAAPIPWRNNQPTANEPVVREAIDPNKFPDKQKVREQLGYEPAVPEDVQDIDPEEWLTHDDSCVIDYVHTRAGRLKIAALTESEVSKIRKENEDWVTPGKPSAGKKVNVDRLRAHIVAVSLNKAYGLTGTDRELTAKRVRDSDRLSGEITMINNKVIELSGFDAGEVQTAANFL